MENNEFTDIYKDYIKSYNYFNKMDLISLNQSCVDFYEGRQWGKIGEKTKKLPRATFNLVELIVNSKVSTMVSSPLKVIFTSSDMPAQAERLTQFNHVIEKEMDFDSLCEDVINQGAVEGSSFVHFYWDSDAVGKRGEYRGGVRAERIDPLNIVFENPMQEDVQKQKWIILSSRLNIDEVQSLCEKSKDKKFITADEELNQVGKVNVYTKYFRRDGEVFFERATKNVLLHSPRPISPQYNEKSNNFYRFRASMYPIEVYQYKQRKNCIYGRGEVEPIIANNRTINFNTAMMSKGVEDQGFGTIIQREGALRPGEKLTNDSSKVIVDRYKGGQNGFYNLTKQPFTPEAYQLNKDILETTRKITGATEVMTGEVMYNNQSGTSIAYLQKQAMRPLEKLFKRYKKFRTRCAEILFQFYCLYYEDREFSIYKGENETLTNNDITIKQSFKSSEYKNIDFDIMVQVASTNEYSEINEIALLDNLLKTNNISLKTYYKVYPSNLLPDKERLLGELENEENSKINMLAAENEALKNELERVKNEFDYQTIFNKITSLTEQNKKLIKLLSEK